MALVRSQLKLAALRRAAQAWVEAAPDVAEATARLDRVEGYWGAGEARAVRDRLAALVARRDAALKMLRVRAAKAEARRDRVPPGGGRSGA